MPAKRCIETKNMCLLFVDYCKSFVVPKENRGNGYRKEKILVVPKEKSGNGYRKEKEFLIPISKGILIWE